MAECELGNPFKSGSKVKENTFFKSCNVFYTIVIVNAWKKMFVCMCLQTTFYIILSTAGISPNVNEVEIDLHLNTLVFKPASKTINKTYQLTVYLQHNYNVQ